MASPEAAVIAALKSASVASGRVFIHGGRQGSEYPYVTVQRITTAGAAYLDGASNLDWPLIQIDCWSPVALTALTIAEAVRAAIDGVDITTTDPAFHAVFQDQRGAAPDDETRNFRVSQDYHVYHERN